MRIWVTRNTNGERREECDGQRSQVGSCVRLASNRQVGLENEEERSGRWDRSSDLGPYPRGAWTAELFCAFTLQNVILTYDLWPVRISRELSDLLFLVLKWNFPEACNVQTSEGLEPQVLSNKDLNFLRNRLFGDEVTEQTLLLEFSPLKETFMEWTCSQLLQWMF